MRAQTSEATCAARCRVMRRLSAAECVRLGDDGGDGAEPMTALVRVWA